MVANRERILGSSGWRALRDPAVARAWPSGVAAATAIALVVGMAFDAGGYFPASYLGAGAVAALVLAALLVVRPPHYPLSRQALLGLGSLLALALWIGLSTRWSTSPDTGMEDMQRALMYSALFGLALVASGSGRLARQIVWGVFAATLLVIGAGLVSRLYPGLLASGSDRFTGYRLAYPVAYWNAFGALAAFGSVLATGLAADVRSRTPLRALAAAAAVAMGTAMYLSFSRGAWLALFLGLAVLFLLGVNRLSLLTTTALVGLASLITIGQLQSYPALTVNPRAAEGQLAAGQSFGPKLLLILAVAAAAQAVAAVVRISPELGSAVRRVIRPVLVVIAAAGVVALAGYYLLNASAVEGRVARSATAASSWLSRQWSEFARPTTISHVGNRRRLTTVRGTRSDLYRVAVNGFQAHPVRGEGAGSFQVRWALNRRVPEYVRDGHSLYLETLTELGLVGALLVLGFIASLVGAAVRARKRPAGLGRSQAAAVSAACAVWVVHAGIDWDWEVPAFTGMVIVLAATLYPYGVRARLAPGAQSRPPSEAGIAGAAAPAPPTSPKPAAEDA